MANKDNFITAIKDDGLTTSHLTRTFDFPDLPSTGDYDQNILVIAEFCTNLNEYLQAILNGVPILDYMLRSGQRNAALQAVALSGLEGTDPEA